VIGPRRLGGMPSGCYSVQGYYMMSIDNFQLSLFLPNHKPTTNLILNIIHSTSCAELVLCFHPYYFIVILGLEADNPSCLELGISCYTIQYDTIGCNSMWSKMMWWNMKCCDARWYGVISCDAIWYDVMPCDIMRHDATWRDVMRYNLMWCNP
jgi:hypothetical protein